MNFDVPNIVVMLIFSGIGFVYLSYGRKLGEFDFIISGVLLMVYSYFTPSVLWTVIVGAIITAIPYIRRRL